MSSRDDTWQPGNSLAKLCLAGLMVTLLAISCCVPPPRNRVQERLDELGVDKETYRAMPVERQIEILVELERYFPHNSTVRMWMQTAIRDKGQEAVDPLVETIRALADQDDMTFLEKMTIADLAYVLGWIHLSKQADLKGTAAQTVLEEVAASNIEEPLRWEIRSALYMILCDKDPPIYPEEPDLTCAE